MSLYRILYRSKISGALSKEDIEGIVHHARTKNADNAITGVLLNVDDYFMQVIEGEEDVIKDLYYGKILHDKRHFRLKILLEGPVQSRDFPEWDMGIRLLNEKDMAAHNEGKDVMENADIVYSILKYFYVTGEMELNSFWKSN